MDKGFIAIQSALDTSFIEIVSKRPFNTSLSFQEFPYPPHYADDGFSIFFIHILPVVTMFSFVFLCPVILRNVVEEKVNGIKVNIK